MAQKRKLHEPRWALVPALRAPEHLLHPPPMLSTQTRSSTKRALSREPFTNRNFPDETIPSVDKKRLLALIQDLAQTQERQDALQGALQTVKMEKSQAQGSVLALQRETAELKDLKIRLEKELNEALESLQKYEAQVKMLEEVVHRPRPKTHEIAIGPASSLALDEASISKDCRKNESLHESALELQKEVSTIEDLQKEIVDSDAEDVTQNQTTILTECLKAVKEERKKEALPRHTAPSAKPARDVQALLKAVLETYTSQLPSPPAVVPAQKNQSIQRFLDMSKKNTLNISALFEKSFSKPPGNSEMRHRDGASDLLSSLLLDDSSVSLSSLTMESTIHHQKPTAPRRMQKKSVEIQTEETESMPPPMQQEQKGQTETPQLSETQDPGLSLNPSFTKAFSTTAATLTKSSDLKCGCQTVLSFCPLCSGVHQQLRKQPSFSSVRSLTVPLSQALRPVTIDQSRSLSQSLNSMKAPQAQNSFLFGNETSMLKSLADIVLEMEGAPLTPPIVKRVQMRRSVSREIGSQRQRSHSSKRRSKSKVNCGPESSVISLDPDLHLVLSLLKS